MKEIIKLISGIKYIPNIRNLHICITEKQGAILHGILFIVIGYTIIN